MLSVAKNCLRPESAPLALSLGDNLLPQNFIFKSHSNLFCLDLRSEPHIEFCTQCVIMTFVDEGANDALKFRKAMIGNMIWMY